MMNLDFTNLWFVSFADSRLKAPLRRIRRQAKKFGFLDNHTFCFDENDLDDDFREKMKEHLIPGSRGFGYWCWKPQVILQVLQKMNDSDILLYTDVGCHLNYRGRDRFADYVDIAKQQGILGFQARSPNTPPTDTKYHHLPDRSWTKGDLLDYFGVRDNPCITETGQIGSGIILIAKTASTIELFSRFRDTYLTHYELADDSPSHSPNFDDFRENRHDQSIFSILYKLSGYDSLTDCEHMAPMAHYDATNPKHQIIGKDFFDHPYRRPVWSVRDKACGIRSLVPIRWKPTLWKLLSAISS